MARQWRRCRKKEVADEVVEKKKRRSEARKRRCKKKSRRKEGRKEIGRVDRIELYGTLIRGRNSEGTGTL